MMPVVGPTDATEVLPLLQMPPNPASDKVISDPSQRSLTPVIGATVGSPDTIVMGKVTADVPQLPEIAYDMITVPPVIPDTKPVSELTVAIEVLSLVHVPPVIISLSVVDEPVQTLVRPAIGEMTGIDVTVIVLVTEQ